MLMLRDTIQFLRNFEDIFCILQWNSHSTKQIAWICSNWRSRWLRLDWAIVKNIDINLIRHFADDHSFAFLPPPSVNLASFFLSFTIYILFKVKIKKLPIFENDKFLRLKWSICHVHQTCVCAAMWLHCINENS